MGYKTVSISDVEENIKSFCFCSPSLLNAPLSCSPLRTSCCQPSFSLVMSFSPNLLLMGRLWGAFYGYFLSASAGRTCVLQCSKPKGLGCLSPSLTNSFSRPSCNSTPLSQALTPFYFDFSPFKHWSSPYSSLSTRFPPTPQSHSPLVLSCLSYCNPVGKDNVTFLFCVAQSSCWHLKEGNGW